MPSEYRDRVRKIAEHSSRLIQQRLTERAAKKADGSLPARPSSLQRLKDKLGAK